MNRTIWNLFTHLRTWTLATTSSELHSVFCTFITKKPTKLFQKQLWVILATETWSKLYLTVDSRSLVFLHSFECVEHSFKLFVLQLRLHEANSFDDRHCYCAQVLVGTDFWLHRLWFDLSARLDFLRNSKSSSVECFWKTLLLNVHVSHVCLTSRCFWRWTADLCQPS